MHYVTCQIKPTVYLQGLGYKTKRFAIACKDEDEQLAVAMNLSSMDGVSYVRLRSTKPYRRIILSAKDNYEKSLNL